MAPPTADAKSPSLTKSPNTTGGGAESVSKDDTQISLPAMAVPPLAGAPSILGRISFTLRRSGGMGLAFALTASPLESGIHLPPLH